MTRIERLLGLAVVMAVLPAGAALAEAKVSFKLDPRLTRSLYMGDRWVSPPTYVRTADGSQVAIEARLEASPKDAVWSWESADPARVVVSPSQGRKVMITVLCPAASDTQEPESSVVNVSSGTSSKQLTVATICSGESIHAEIRQ